MKWRIRSTVARASRVRSSGRPCSFSTALITARTAARCPAALSGGNGGERVITAPELPRGEIEFALDADEVGLGGGQHLIGRQAGIEFQFQLLGELLGAHPPLAIGPRPDFLFEERLIVLQAGDDLRGGLLQCLFLRRFERPASPKISV